MELTVQNLEHAVSIFYNGDQNDQMKAHSWLSAAQRSPEAWNFVWDLLQPNKGTEVQFYGATTLHTKILRCWHELSSDSHDELKERILEAVFTYSKGPKIVTNRLCISFAAFILQQGTTDLATILRPLSSADNTALLLEVLTVIPEEFKSMTMGLGRRADNRAVLQKACPAVLDDMLRYLQTVYNDYSKQAPSKQLVQTWCNAATCASSWLTLGSEESGNNATLPDRMPLCRTLLTVVHLLYTRNEIVSDTVLDTCEACLSAVRSAGGGHDATRYPQAAMELLSQLAALATPIMQRDNVPNSINEELLSALITCCVALGECHINTLVKAAEGLGDLEDKSEGARQLIELMLAVQVTPGHYPLHETRSNLVFGFWYMLQDEVLILTESNKRMNQMWNGVFTRLLETLMTKSEAREDNALSKDDLEILRCYRQDIADTVMYCFGILGEWCWASVEARYEGATTDAAREAALHVFLALADAAPPQRAPPGLLPMLQHAAEQVHSALALRMLNTALDCLGSYASWLSSMDGARYAALGAECVRATGMALARSPATAALSLRKLCADCTLPAAAVVADIVQLSCSHLESDSDKTDVWVTRQLVGAAGAALVATEPATASALLAQLAASIQRRLHTQSVDPSRASGAEQCAAALLASLHMRPQLAGELFKAVLPALPTLAQKRDLVEPMFHILKQTVSTLMVDSKILIGDIAQLTITGFEHTPCPTGLDVVKLLVIFVGGEWPECGRLLHACVSHTARAVLPSPSAEPELVEALFTTLHMLTKKKPFCIDWINDLLPELVDLACHCVRMWEACAARAACGWLGALAAGRPRALQPRAPSLTAAALRCIGGATPRNHIGPLAELLLALNRAQWAEETGGAGLQVWLPRALAVHGFPTPHATEAHKRKFIAAVIKEKSSKRRLLETVQEFSLVCRGLIGTEYARETLASKQLVT